MYSYLSVDMFNGTIRSYPYVQEKPYIYIYVHHRTVNKFMPLKLQSSVALKSMIAYLTLSLTAQVIYDLAFSMENYSKKF